MSAGRRAWPLAMQDFRFFPLRLQTSPVSPAQNNLTESTKAAKACFLLLPKRSTGSKWDTSCHLLIEGRQRLDHMRQGLQSCSRVGCIKCRASRSTAANRGQVCCRCICCGCPQAQPCVAKTTGSLSPLRGIQVQAGEAAKTSPDLSIKLHQSWPLRCGRVATHAVDEAAMPRPIPQQATCGASNNAIIASKSCLPACTRCRVCPATKSGVPMAAPSKSKSTRLWPRTSASSCGAVRVADEVGPTATSSHLSKFKVRPTDSATCWMAWRPRPTERASRLPLHHLSRRRRRAWTPATALLRAGLLQQTRGIPPLAAPQPPMGSRSPTKVYSDEGCW